VVNVVISQLKKGSIQNVALFSDGAAKPLPPYVVVRPEAGEASNTRAYRISAHHSAGKLDELEAYVFKELDALLGGSIDGQDGSRYRLYPHGFSDVASDTEGGTIFMERIYLAPLPGMALRGASKKPGESDGSH